MYLKKLELINFRNYSKLNLNFSKGVILIVGDNGQGKTNLLESIYYLSTGKSHRSYNHNELIRWEEDFSILRAEVSSESAKKIEHLIEIELKENNIKIRVDKAYRKRKSEFISILPSVIFSPDDLGIIKSSPSNRRNFIDSILDQIHNDFYRTRLQYQKILNQRNSLIKSISSSMKIADNKTLESWDDNIVKYGTKIIEKRYQFIQEIRKDFIKYMKFFFDKLNVDIFYVFSWNRKNFRGSYDDGSFDYTGNNLGNIIRSKEEIDSFGSKLKENLKKDLSFKTTTIGPHRDDFAILIDGKDIRSFGSQGQQRVASISLKLCELNILKEKLKTDPVFLLDDVLSELDLERKKLLIKAINNNLQTFITTTNINYLSDIDINFTQKFSVKNNKIEKID